jgi:hypothetical protein
MQRNGKDLIGDFSMKNEIFKIKTKSLDGS